MSVPPSGAGARPPEQDLVFQADWLTLREPADHRSRAGELVAILADEWRARGWSRVLDLGCGTGSNARYLAPRLGGPQRWALLDHDPEVLSRLHVPDKAGTPDVRLGSLRTDGLALVAEADLVTGAALLDLVGADWLSSLAEACAARGAGALFTTIYDGTLIWEASRAGELLDGDDLVGATINAHHRRDKGLGPALGPDAAFRARELFMARGYRTWLMPSPWILGADDARLALALLDGWVRAALEQSPGAEGVIRSWAARRRALAEQGAFRLTVGHLDLLALP